MHAQSFYCLDAPLETVPTGRQMRIANLQGFSALARRYGSSPRELLERHNIDSRFVDDPDHSIDSKAVVDLFEYCSAKFDAPLFGLQLAQQQDADIFGSVTALCRAAPSVRDAINGFVDYIPVVHSPATSLALVEGKSTAELRWHVHSDLAQNSQANFQAVVLDLKLLRQIAGSALCPSYVNLAMDVRPKNIDKVEQQLGCRFYCTDNENAIAFPAHILEKRVASANRVVFKLLGGYLERMKAATRISLPERIHDYIRAVLPSGNVSVEHCAQRLGLSVRTLQLRLHELKVSFSDMVESQRAEQAKSYLQNLDGSLMDIAFQLGYSDQTSFGRAFKRWTNLTPRRYRESLLIQQKGQRKANPTNTDVDGKRS